MELISCLVGDLCPLSALVSYFLYRVVTCCFLDMVLTGVKSLELDETSEGNMGIHKHNEKRLISVQLFGHNDIFCASEAWLQGRIYWHEIFV